MGGNGGGDDGGGGGAGGGCRDADRAGRDRRPRRRRGRRGRQGQGGGGGGVLHIERLPSDVLHVLFKTLCVIGRARLRIASKRVHESEAARSQPLDVITVLVRQLQTVSLVRYEKELLQARADLPEQIDQLDFFQRIEVQRQRRFIKEQLADVHAAQDGSPKPFAPVCASQLMTMPAATESSPGQPWRSRAATCPSA